MAKTSFLPGSKNETNSQKTDPILLPALVLVAVILLWVVISYANLFPAYALPTPGSVLKSFKEEFEAGRLLNDIIASLWRVAVGFVLAAVLGIPAKSAPIDMRTIIFDMLTIKGIYGREMYETWYKMSVMLDSGLDISPVITHHFRYDEYEKLWAWENPLAVLAKPDEKADA